VGAYAPLIPPRSTPGVVWSVREPTWLDWLTIRGCAERRTQRAAADHPSLVLATKAGASGELLGKLLDAYASEPGAIAVDLLLCDSQQQRHLSWGLMAGAGWPARRSGPGF